MNMPFNNQTVAKKLTENAKTIRINDVTASLMRLAQARKEAEITPAGALVATTGKFTGRSAQDKYIVANEVSEGTVWWDNTNRMDQNKFDLLLDDMLVHAGDKLLFQQQLFAGADEENRFDVDVFCENAWHSLFIRHLLLRPNTSELEAFSANVTVVQLPSFSADPKRHGTRSDTCIALDFARNIVLICGTAYAGEIKKSVFSLFNFHAPTSGVLPMHCSANVGVEGDTTLFFGLSGTGKTTLSTSADRALVGDDEHGWSADGVFNLEGGCYAKAINLNAENEPEIYATTHQVGTIMENVSYDAATDEFDFDDGSITENTRIAYPLTAIKNRVKTGTAPAPKNVVLLAADAFGVLPPIARLTREQAIFYFLSGYTAKLAGTERGVTEPQATFSACFGAPFMSRHPSVYGELLAQKLETSGAHCWLLNTGWTGGAYGVGKRMALKTTRRILNAALDGELDGAEFRVDPIFGLSVPTQIEDVEDDVLDPSRNWADVTAYQKQAELLAEMFEENFSKLGPDAHTLSATGLPKRNAA